MSEVREEYTRETYPSFGKKYNGERAVISLTSWKARISTCSKTIFSLLKQCPGFHIVLVLSEEEFPKMMDELPDNLKLFVDNELIEILWVYKNYKSLKKILFTQDKYPDVPIISADDDKTYIINYAEELYQKWLENKDSLITIYPYPLSKRTAGPSTLYYPHCFGNFTINDLLNNNHLDIYESADDGFYEMLRGKFKNSNIIWINKNPYTDRNSDSPLGHVYGNNTFMSRLRTAQNDDIKGNIFEFIGPD